MAIKNTESLLMFSAECSIEQKRKKSHSLWPWLISGCPVACCLVLAIVSIFYFLSSSEKSGAYLSCIAACLATIFAFTVQIILLTRSKSQLEHERYDKTQHDFTNFVIKKRPINYAILSIYEETNHLFRLETSTEKETENNYKFNFSLSGDLLPKEHTSKNDILSAYFVNSLNLLKGNEFIKSILIKEVGMNQNPSSQDLMNALFRETEIIINTIEKICESHYRGLYDDEFFNKQLNREIFLFIKALLPVMVLFGDLGDAPFIVYTLAKEEERHE